MSKHKGVFKSIPMSEYPFGISYFLNFSELIFGIYYEIL